MTARDFLKVRYERANQAALVYITVPLLVLGMYGHVKQRYMAAAAAVLAAWFVAHTIRLRRTRCPYCAVPLGKVAAQVGEDRARVDGCPHCGESFDTEIAIERPSEVTRSGS
jgi:hypothetical protein